MQYRGSEKFTYFSNKKAQQTINGKPIKRESAMAFYARLAAEKRKGVNIKHE